MKQTFIVVPNSKSSELQKSLVLHGVNFFNTSIITPIQLAKLSLVKSGDYNYYKVLSSIEQTGVYYNILKNNKYKNFSTKTINDAQNLATYIDSVRKLIEESEKNKIKKILNDPPFIDKNIEIIDIYFKYREHLTKNNLFDNISLIRKASNKSSYYDANYIIFEEFELQPVELKLLNHVSNNKFAISSISDFCKKKNNGIKIASYLSAYDITNEIKSIFGRIVKDKISFDKVCVYCTDVKHYSQLFYDYSNTYNVPITFGCGIPASNTNAAKLLSKISKWMTSQYYGVEGLSSIINSDCFNKEKLYKNLLQNIKSPKKIKLEDVVYRSGRLRIGFNSKKNFKRINLYASSNDESKEFVLAIKKLASEIEKGIVYLIETYTNTNFNDINLQKFNVSALQSVIELLKEYLAFCSYNEINQITEIILSKNLCKEPSQPGNIHIDSIDNSLSIIRESTFFVGLSSDNFPGQIKENYIMLDKDYLNINDTRISPTSFNLMNQKKEMFKTCISNLSSFDCSIFLSWSEFNFYNRKELSLTSCVYDIFSVDINNMSKSNDLESVVKTSSFFDKAFDTSDIFGKYYINDYKLDITTNSSSQQISIEKNRFSPSAIEKFQTCPRLFYFKYILGLEPNDEIDNYEALSPIDKGILFHDLMNLLANNTMSKPRFIEHAKKSIDNYFIANIALFKTEQERNTKNFLLMINNAYDMEDNTREISCSEQFIDFCDSKSSITIYGRPDRVEKTKENNLIVVDYKTGQNIKQTKEIFDTYLQTSLYAYILSNINYSNLSHSEYKYPVVKKTIECPFTKAEIININKILDKLKTCLRDGKFSTYDSTDKKYKSGLVYIPCRYCQYVDICQLPFNNQVLEDNFNAIPAESKSLGKNKMPCTCTLKHKISKDN